MAVLGVNITEISIWINFYSIIVFGHFNSCVGYYTIFRNK